MATFVAVVTLGSVVLLASASFAAISVRPALVSSHMGFAAEKQFSKSLDAIGHSRIIAHTIVDKKFRGFDESHFAELAGQLGSSAAAVFDFGVFGKCPLRGNIAKQASEADAKQRDGCCGSRDKQSLFERALEACGTVYPPAVVVPTDKR